MEIVIIISIIGFIIYIFSRSPKKVKEPIEIPLDITIATSIGGNSNYSPKMSNPIEQDSHGNWILNPGAPFELTVLSQDKKLVKELRDLLDDNEIQYYRKESNLIALFAENNLKIKEIEEYKNKYKSQYQGKIEDLQSGSSEWSTSGAKDREDLMIEFRQLAINSIYEKANCDLEILFENEPVDITFDDMLIKEYGFDNIQTYIRYCGKLDKVRIIPNDNYSRPIFEKLVDLGLAIRGNSIPREEVLSALTLNELNAIAQNQEKDYKRKNQAIEYIVTLDDLDDRIGRHISLREMFKLMPLPERYISLNIQEIANTWEYHGQEVSLLVNTYRTALYSMRDLTDLEYIKGFKVSPLEKQNPCPCSIDLERKRFSKNNPPRIPYHIGCNCFLEKEFTFD